MEESRTEEVDVLGQERELLEKYWKYVCEESLATVLVPLLQGELMLSSTTDEILRRYRGEAVDQIKFLIGYLLKREQTDNFLRFWRCVEVASPPRHSLMKKVNEKRTSAGLEAIPPRSAVYFKERQILGEHYKEVAEQVKANDILPGLTRKFKLTQAELSMIRHCNNNFSQMAMIMDNMLMKRSSDDHAEFWRCIQASAPQYHTLVQAVDKARVRFGLESLTKRPSGEFSFRFMYGIQPADNEVVADVATRRKWDIDFYNHVKPRLEGNPTVIQRLLKVEDVKCLSVLSGSIHISVHPLNPACLKELYQNVTDAEFSTRSREVLDIVNFERDNSVVLTNVKVKYERRDLLRARDELVAATSPDEMWYMKPELQRMRKQLLAARSSPDSGEVLVTTEWAENFNLFITGKEEKLPGPVEYIEPSPVMFLDSSISRNDPAVLSLAERYFGKNDAKKRLVMKEYDEAGSCLFDPNKPASPSHVTALLIQGEVEICTRQVQVSHNFNRIYRELHSMGLIVEGNGDPPPAVCGKEIDTSTPPPPTPQSEPEPDEEEEEEKMEDDEFKLLDPEQVDTEENAKEENKKETEEEPKEEEEEKEKKPPKLRYKLVKFESSAPLDSWVWKTETIDGNKHVCWQEEEEEEAEETKEAKTAGK